MRTACPVCGKIVGAYVPRGGDGSAVRPRRHSDKANGRVCEGRLWLVDRADTDEDGQET